MVTTSNRDIDCAMFARAALFPPRLDRGDGSHASQYPALVALGDVRDDAMAANQDRASSSFFPSHVLVVRAVAGNYHGELQWNGQPIIDESNASFDVIPRMLSVRCMECNDMMAKNNDIPPDKKVFSKLVEEEGAISSNITHLTPVVAGEKGKERNREVILCSDRVLKKDYSPDRIPSTMSMDFPPRSFQAVEEALAHEITKIGDQLKFDRSVSDKSSSSNSSMTSEQIASSEIRAAGSGECYYSKVDSSVRRGSQLGMSGYSYLPTPIQRMIRNRCIRSVATKALPGADNAKYIGEIFETIMQEENEKRRKQQRR